DPAQSGGIRAALTFDTSVDPSAAAAKGIADVTQLFSTVTGTLTDPAVSISFDEDPGKRFPLAGPPGATIPPGATTNFSSNVEVPRVVTTKLATETDATYVSRLKGRQALGYTVRGQIDGRFA